MKLSAKKKPVQESSDEVTEAKIETMEERFGTLSEALSALEAMASDLPQTFNTQITERVNRAVEAFNDMREQALERSEDKIVLRVLDFMQQCPFWEMKKIPHSEHNKNDAAATFGKLLKEGWRYVNTYYSPAPPHERYDIFFRPAGRALTEQEYLKQYNEFQRRREERATAEKKSSKPAAKPEVKGKVKLVKKSK